jgi:hypothetical protein
MKSEQAVLPNPCLDEEEDLLSNMWLPDLFWLPPTDTCYQLLVVCLLGGQIRHALDC